MAPKTVWSAEGATHPHLAAHPTGPIPSIPNIPFVEFHAVFVQQIAVLFLERVCAMMFLLVVYVAHQVFQLTPADGEVPVASLPEEPVVLAALI